MLYRARELIELVAEYIALACDDTHELETLTLIAKLDARYTMQLLYCLGMEFRKPRPAPQGPSEEEEREAAQLALLEKVTPMRPQGTEEEIAARRTKQALDNLEKEPMGPTVESFSCACCERPLDSVKNKPRAMPLHVVVDAFGAPFPARLLPLSMNVTKYHHCR